MKHNPEMIESVARVVDESSLMDWESCVKIAQAALDAAFEWRDIETAPKDGRFLVFGNGNELDGMSLSSADWVKLYKDAEGFTYTHWLPLPTPPEGD